MLVLAEYISTYYGKTDPDTEAAYVTSKVANLTGAPQRALDTIDKWIAAYTVTSLNKFYDNLSVVEVERLMLCYDPSMRG
jgi:hypothetical protein